jgi:hypothetical protein
MSYIESNESDDGDDAPQDDFNESEQNGNPTNDDGYDITDETNDYDDNENIKDNLMLQPGGFDDDEYADDDSADAGMDSFENELLQNDYNLVIPQDQVLDTKPVTKSIRTGVTMTTDPFGTGELFDDEASVTTVLALLGLLLVIIVLTLLYRTFRQTMDITPASNGKKGSSKQDTFKVTTSPLIKRRE